MANMIVDPKFRSRHTLEDELLYLLLLSKMPQNQVNERLEQKLLFLVEYQGFQEGLKISHLPYEMDQMGPYSKLQTDIRRNFAKNKLITLQHQQYVNKPAHVAKLTDFGFAFLDEIENIFDENDWMVGFFDEIVGNYGSWNARILTEQVVDQLPHAGKKIGDFQMKEAILFNYPKVVKEFKLSRDWIETINFFKDPNLSREFDVLCNELEQGKNYPLQPLI